VKVAVVLNGEEPSSEEIKLLDACDAVVCADGAAMVLLKAQRAPTVIVGDLDSLDPEAYKWADALDVPIERYPERKDETDGELALDKALALGAKSILFLGAHGKRSAMFMGNMQLLRRCHEKGMDAAMVGRGESIRFVSAGGELYLTGRTGATLNVLPVGGPAIIDLVGTDWDGESIELAHLSCRGMSNKILSDGARLRVRKGLVQIVVERRPEKTH
jgi:thiamine pyrophosphokinase